MLSVEVKPFVLPFWWNLALVKHSVYADALQRMCTILKPLSIFKLLAGNNNLDCMLGDPSCQVVSKKGSGDVEAHNPLFTDIFVSL